MAYNIDEIEGIGQAYAQKLRANQITTTTELLEKGSSKKEREKIAGATGISESLILRWVNHADLFRINGVV
jgi:hypothetical protein